MKRTMWVGGIAALTVVLSAATWAQTPSAKTQSKDTVTITGCLQPNTGATSSAGAQEQFILANAQKGAGSAYPGSAPTGTAGTTPGTPSPSPSPSASAPSESSMSSLSYIVEGDTAELKKHVGHQIEVTGHLDNSGAPTSPAESSSGEARQKVHVNSVRMISASCSAK